MFKVIYTTGNINRPEDPTLPYRLYANLHAPEFMKANSMKSFGAVEEVIMRATTIEELRDGMKNSGISKEHPRMRRYMITGPDGVTVERFDVFDCDVGMVQG